MEFFRKSNIDFVSKGKIAIFLSLLAILGGIVSLIMKGGPAYNIDFLGGVELQIQFQQPRNTQALRDFMSSLNYSKAEIKQFGGPHNFIVRFQESEAQKLGSDEILSNLKQAFPDDNPQLLSVSRIGPKIGAELRESAVWAVLLSLALILLYISFRFQFIFAVGAVIALVHDVLMTLGFCSVLNIEISLGVLAAFLTLVGYSLNDTIVVFDRIRENLVVHRRQALTMSHIVNLSINETLSRTILTGCTTLMVIIVALVFGGEVLRDFFLCLFFGILVGTYSSIFIAAPVLVTWYSKHGVEKPKRKIAFAAR